MKAILGHLLLVRVDNNSLLERFSSDAFTSMVANPKLTSTFHPGVGHTFSYPFASVCPLRY